jgi:transcriptional regulator with XRE-family HTH domain
VQPTQEATPRKVGRAVKIHMTRRDLHQADVAKILGLSIAATSRRLSGKIPLNVAELQLLADAFSVTLPELLDA